MVGEHIGSKTVTYLRGANLISRSGDGKAVYYLFNAHGDVTELLSDTGTVTHKYDYDAFGVEKKPDPLDGNPFRYCGEYYDGETKIYYLRARYYNPNIGRFTQQDTHWTTANSIYGDNPQKINEREDKLGLKTYSYAPQITAVMQSGNLYVYGVGNPVAYVDRDGNIAFLVITALAGVAIGAIAGAIQSYVEYGEIHWENVAIGAGIGGIAGLAGGAVAGVVFAGSATAPASVVIAGMGTTGTVAAGGTALAANQINTILSNVIPNRINHIMQTKHAWNLVGAEDWKTVSNIIGLVLTKGIGTLNSVGNTIYSFVYKGQVIEVTTRVVDGAVQLVDAWVKTR